MGAVTRFLAADRSLDSIAQQLRDLRNEWRRARDDYDRAEREAFRAEQRRDAIKDRAWGVIDAGPDFDFGELVPDEWE